MKHDLSKYSLSPTEFSVLDVLYLKGKQTVQQICNSVLLASGSMTYVIDKLEQKGLLQRCDCREDRRVVHVVITGQGNLLMNKVFPEYQKLIQDIFENISAEEKKTMKSVLERIGHTAKILTR
ncbi:MarR family winged helix-turn-helix transcriptional regulator [Bacillus sp. FJAT-29790]|uniref:MarR family winged helix-turn-helix transcriptional regulator n=1 Tax=Bacillus sp. FJAT-29790 TaxID=1895002 RepID=UPI00349F987D